MKQVLCAKCKKRPAMFFVTKVEGEKTTQEGLCIKCAMEMNIGPVKQIMQSMGISEDEIDDVSEQFEAMFGEDGGFEPGGAGTMPFLQNLQNFGAVSGGEDNQTTSEGSAEKPAKKKSKLGLIIGAIAGVAVIAAVLIILLGANGRKYKKAMGLIDKGNYDKAYELFVELDDYKDAEMYADRFFYV